MCICNKKIKIKNLTYLYVKNVKLYSLFILNKILLQLVLFIFKQKKKYIGVKILMFLTYNKIVYSLLKI